MTPLLLLWLQQAASASAGASASPDSPTGGVLGELLRVLVALGLVSAAAFFALRWLARRGRLGPGLTAKDGAGIRLQVLARVALEPRKALYLVKVGERTLLLGTGEGGPPSLLVDLGTGALAAQRALDPADSGTASADGEGVAVTAAQRSDRG